MNKNRSILIFFLLILVFIKVSAQLSFMTKELNSGFERGMELFNKEKYPAAIRFFDSFIKSGNSESQSQLDDAEYFSSLAAIKLFNTDAEYRMTGFIARHPASPRINEAWFALGDYFYQNKNYKKAILYYESVNRQELTVEKLPGYYFRLGYSHFMKGERQKALLMFSEIKDIDTEFTPPAIY
jgi:TolA-binding protein